MVLHPDLAKETDSGLLSPKHKLLPLSACYESDLSHDRATRRSTGGAARMTGKGVVINKPKRQTSIEASTCGAELSVGRADTGHCEKIPCVSRIL